jgi:poly(A) polymerase
MSTDPARPACTRDDAVAVVRTLRDAGHVAYFAGGCVRDTLLGLTPKDYDVATDAPPQRVRQLFRNTQAVGAVFGVILVRLGQSVIEVATFRTDGHYTDGRRPDTVTFATAEEDAKRRDFTINGLFMDPLDGDKVIDYVGGQADLAAKVVRAIGNPDERFAEDHLRLLRAVRFAARLGFEIEPTTADAIRRHAAELPRISPERIADELRRMVVGPSRKLAWRGLHDLGLADSVFRHLPRGGDQTWAIHGVSLLLGPLDRLPLGATLAVLSLDWRWQRAGRPEDVRPWLTKAEVTRVSRAMRQGLKISNEEAADLEGTLSGVGAMLAEPEPGVAAKKRFLSTPTSQYARSVLFSLATVGCLEVVRIVQLLDELDRLSKTDFAPPPLVTGDDLTAAGATPGPAFKRALDAAYDAQLEDRVSDKAAALALALDVIRQ